MKKMADDIMWAVGSVNPYRRNQLNSPKEYYLYNMGYLAGYLGSLLEREPQLRAEFYRKIKRDQSGAGTPVQAAKPR